MQPIYALAYNSHFSLQNLSLFSPTKAKQQQPQRQETENASLFAFSERQSNPKRHCTLQNSIDTRLICALLSLVAVIISIALQLFDWIQHVINFRETLAYTCARTHMKLWWTWNKCSQTILSYVSAIIIIITLPFESNWILSRAKKMTKPKIYIRLYCFGSNGKTCLLYPGLFWLSILFRHT